MYSGRTLFSQVMDLVPWTSLDRIVVKYGGDIGVRTLRCTEHFRVMGFAQITYRESLRDIEACLGSQPSKLYGMGLRGPVAKSTLADANELRDWRIWSDLAAVLIKRARKLYMEDDIGLDLVNTVFALDLITLEAGAIYVMDRGYIDFRRLYAIHQAGAFFVTRTKNNMKYHRLYSHAVDKTTGVGADQSIALDGFYTKRDYPQHLRRVSFCDPETSKRLVFLTNNFVLPAATIAALYKKRWAVELFFKWIKQNLRIKHFYGTSENA